MSVDEAFRLWNEMLTNLGDSYATHERFLRHYYNAFKAELPEVRNAPVATRTNLIRIYEAFLAANIRSGIGALVSASRTYGQVTCVTETDATTRVDDSLRQLMRAQGSPSYVLVMWLLSKQAALGLTEDQLVMVVDRLTSFFVRRNLTGYPQTYALPKLFMTVIDEVSGRSGAGIVEIVRRELSGASSGDDEFRRRLEGPIYEENSDIARFILATLAADAMTREFWTDLWAQEKGHFVWTIEHILPQGANLPDVWKEMLGGGDDAAAAQEAHVHQLGNLTITAYKQHARQQVIRGKTGPDRQQGAFRRLPQRIGAEHGPCKQGSMDCDRHQGAHGRTRREGDSSVPAHVNNQKPSRTVPATSAGCTRGENRYGCLTHWPLSRRIVSRTGRPACYWCATAVSYVTAKTLAVHAGLAVADVEVIGVGGILVASAGFSWSACRACGDLCSAGSCSAA